MQGRPRKASRAFRSVQNLCQRRTIASILFSIAALERGVLFAVAELDSATVLFRFPNDKEQSSGKNRESCDHNPDHYASSNCSIRRYASRFTRTTPTVTAMVTAVPVSTSRRLAVA
jgi:hypothetical protein